MFITECESRHGCRSSQARAMENSADVILEVSIFLDIYLAFTLTSCFCRYRRKPNLYGTKAQFGTYLAIAEHGLIRVGDHIRILREDKSF